MQMYYITMNISSMGQGHTQVSERGLESFLVTFDLNGTFVSVVHYFYAHKYQK